MDISVESTGTLGRRLTVQVPADQVDSRVDGKIREMARNVRMKGFRPGKVPLQVLRQRFGREVRQEVVGELIQETFQRALHEKQLRPASQPSIDAQRVEQGADLAYTASFEVYPEIEALDVSALALERPTATVTDGDVDRMIETLREQRKTWSERTEPAREGDLVFFTFAVTLEDGARFPEGEDPSRAGAVLGGGGFDRAFEEQLVGLATGDDIAFDCTFSERAREPKLAGRSGSVTGRVERVQSPELPAVDEAFIESFGIEGGDMATFREEVRKNLERELKQAVSRRLRGAVVEALEDAHADLTIPDGMVTQEAANLQGQAREQVERAGADPASVPTLEQLLPQARRRVHAAILMGEVARHASLEVDMGRVRDMVIEIASTYDDPQAVIQLYYEREELLSGIQNMVLEEQAVEWVLANATVSEREYTFDEIMQAARSAA